MDKPIPEDAVLAAKQAAYAADPETVLTTAATRAALAAAGVQAGEVEQRARELLAAEYSGDVEAKTRILRDHLDDGPAIRAIVSALSQQPEARGVPLEPAEKPVAWWNGISPDKLGRDWSVPSVRWGADAEDSGHDVPLYSGYNPIHYAKPEARGVVDVEAMVERMWECWQSMEDGRVTRETFRAILTAALTGERNG